jgi:hypothetical protein
VRAKTTENGLKWSWGSPRAWWGGPPWWVCSREEVAEEQTTFGFRGHFESRAEVVESLERYPKALEAEAQATRELLAEQGGSP